MTKHGVNDTSMMHKVFDSDEISIYLDSLAIKLQK
jgi:hypothetical protein